MEEANAVTNDQVRDGFNAVYNNFWNKYKNHQPQEGTKEWKEMYQDAMHCREAYPFLAETVSRMLAELTERLRGRGNDPLDFFLPPYANKHLREQNKKE